jgi:hypothetical protein
MQSSRNYCGNGNKKQLSLHAPQKFTLEVENFYIFIYIQEARRLVPGLVRTLWRKVNSCPCGDGILVIRTVAKNSKFIYQAANVYLVNVTMYVGLHFEIHQRG